MNSVRCFDVWAHQRVNNWTDNWTFIRRYLGLTEIPRNIPSGVRSVDLTGNKITTLRSNSFIHFTSCSKLNFNFSRISTIEPGAFHGLYILTELHLQYNKLTELRKGMFLYLGQCEKLYLLKNCISRIEPGAFDGLNNLKILNMYLNPLGELQPDLFQGISQCEELELA